MYFIADFHIHSHYSIATSKNLVPEQLDYWARLKGLGVVGTGDITHPGWLHELKEKLEPAEQGLFRLKRELTPVQSAAFQDRPPRFVLTGEISSIYKKLGRVRKVHSLVFVPDFQGAQKIQAELERLGNIRSDGRPILGLDARDLLEIVLGGSPGACLAPAHIWTPWFSVLGAKSGFDTIEECYGDLAGELLALETGLSSDPPMNWMCSFLDGFSLISNSDAHSPEKLGREANIFDTELSYDGITAAIRSGDPKRFLGTVEFFPQEGKYHFDGHRKCGVCWDPVQTLSSGGICPVCGKNVTVGVMSRVAQRADRDRPESGRSGQFYVSLIPLPEILGEVLGCAPTAKKVASSYHSLVRRAGSELDLLMRVPIEELRRLGNGPIAEAVLRVRNREVSIREGFDGEFGRVRVFPEGTGPGSAFQVSLLEDVQPERTRKSARSALGFDLAEYRKRSVQSGARSTVPGSGGPASAAVREGAALNGEQRRAADHFHGPGIVIAGPGTGKTNTLTRRIARLILDCGVDPDQILAFAFTNKAVEELRRRLDTILRHGARLPPIMTFHSFGLGLLRDHCGRFGRTAGFRVVREDEKRDLLVRMLGVPKNSVRRTADRLSAVKQGSMDTGESGGPDRAIDPLFREYREALRNENAFDLDDLVFLPAEYLLADQAVVSSLRDRYRWLCIDEYQDVNHAQYRLVRALMPGPSADIFVIGDPNQAIYGFRGADVRFIRSFLEDYPDAAVYRLEKSYRCSDVILRASQQILPDAGRDALLRGVGPGVAVNISEHPTDRSEAEFVARTIERMIGGTRFFSIDSRLASGEEQQELTSLAEYAVLCRLGAQMNRFEKAFADHGIPCQPVGEEPFFHREPVRKITDILHVVNNPANRYPVHTRAGQQLSGIARTGDRAGMQRLIERVKGEDSVKNMILRAVEGMEWPETADEEPAVARLLRLAEGFGTSLERFLTYVDTGEGADAYAPNTENVALMTIHAAKGLEFGCVFIPGCEEGLIPYGLFEEQQSDLQEEKRLLYVGMTRARRFLFLSRAARRFLFGREYRLPASSYLDGIQEELVSRDTTVYGGEKRRGEGQLELF